jgi:hypothetical protein
VLVSQLLLGAQYCIVVACIRAAVGTCDVPVVSADAATLLLSKCLLLLPFLLHLLSRPHPSSGALPL